VWSLGKNRVSAAPRFQRVGAVNFSSLAKFTPGEAKGLSSVGALVRLCVYTYPPSFLRRVHKSPIHNCTAQAMSGQEDILDGLEVNHISAQLRCR
jgi:hypothetical protein